MFEGLFQPVHLLVILAICAVVFVPYWKIFKKAGFCPRVKSADDRAAAEHPHAIFLGLLRVACPKEISVAKFRSSASLKRCPDMNLLVNNRRSRFEAQKDSHAIQFRIEFALEGMIAR
jgi:hypothetical protein